MTWSTIKISSVIYRRKRIKLITTINNTISHRASKADKMPRCLMAKKWKAYPWPDRAEEPIIDIEEEEEIDVVGDSPIAGAGVATKSVTTATSTITSAAPSAAASSCWGPSSPTAGATAPSPPPHSPEATRGSTILYNGEFGFISC